MPSKGSGTAAGAAQGAAMGMMFGPWGALAGAVLGGILGNLGTKGVKQVPFVDLPKGKALKTANKLDKASWAQLLRENTGAPQQVTPTYAGAKNSYALGDALGANAGGMASIAQLAPVLQAMAGSQDVNSTMQADDLGTKRHQWAMGGKMQSGAARTEFQQALEQMRMRNKMYNAGLRAQDDAMTAQNWMNTGSAMMSLGAGAMGGAFSGGEKGVPGMQDGAPIGYMPGASSPSLGFTSPGGYANYNPIQWSAPKPKTSPWVGAYSFTRGY